MHDQKPTRPLSVLRAFLGAEASGGVVLMGAAILALIVANSPLSHAYFEALHLHLGPLSISHWINDAMMALFFLLVGLEIKREMLDGQLATWSRRMLPGIVAAGGMLVPALIYVGFNRNDPSTLRGWRLTCPLCGQMLTDNSDQTSISPPNLWHLIRHGERLFQAETNGDSIGWASPAELARLLLMRRVPRPLNVDLGDLARLRVLGAIFPDFDRIVASNDIPLPSAGKPILPIGLRHFLLAAVANVTQIGFEMLETLQSQTLGANRVRFGNFAAEMISRRQESPCQQTLRFHNLTGIHPWWQS